MIYLIIKAKYRDENSQLLFNNFISILGMTQIRNVMPEKITQATAQNEKINQLQSQGLRKMSLTNELPARAERENNLPQQYKCIMTSAQLIQSDEEGVKDLSHVLRKEGKAKEPIKSLLSSVLGSAYKA
jgi:hypothetical protein